LAKIGTKVKWHVFYSPRFTSVTYLVPWWFWRRNQAGSKLFRFVLPDPDTKT